MRVGSASRISRPLGDRLRIGLPKGRFLEHSQIVIEKLGGSPQGAAERAELFDGSVVAYLMKATDIPKAVASGYIDIAIATDDWLLEWEAGSPGNVKYLRKGPRWLRMRLSFFTRTFVDWPISGPASVSTCYPSLARRLMLERGVESSEFFHVTGSTEAFVGDITGIGFDCVETGRTLEIYGLHELFVPYPEIGTTVIQASTIGSQMDIEVLEALYDALNLSPASKFQDPCLG